MLDLLNLPGIKPVDMRHEGMCLVIVAEPVTVRAVMWGLQHPYAQTRYAQKQVHGHAVVHGARPP